MEDDTTNRIFFTYRNMNRFVLHITSVFDNSTSVSLPVLTEVFRTESYQHYNTMVVSPRLCNYKRGLSVCTEICHVTESKRTIRFKCLKH